MIIGNKVCENIIAEIGGLGEWLKPPLLKRQAC